MWPPVQPLCAHARLSWLCLLLALLAPPRLAAGDSWPAAVAALRQEHDRTPVAARLLALWDRFPLETDWLLQDAGDLGAGLLDPATAATAERRLLAAVGLSEREATAMPPSPSLDRYVDACRRRRQERLLRLHALAPSIVFTKHYDLGGSHYAYTEGLSDAQSERHFRPGSALCLLEVGRDAEVAATTVLADPGGVIRDPDVSFDGRTVLFAWKRSDREDDYHLYEREQSSGTIRPLTTGKGVADYEPVYLPDGSILFSSTRCVQSVDCFWTEVSNLFRCNADGTEVRRVGFDQVHTNYPKLLDDGRVIYTRWDYNDRDQIFTQPLFSMNQDGTRQTEFYGNNSWFPTAILHARGIPGTGRVLAVLSGHHTHQRGKLGMIDPALGRQEAAGVRSVAPMGPAVATRADVYGQRGEQFQYPCPLTERDFLVSYTPHDSPGRQVTRPFGLYLMDCDGGRELLAYDPAVSCSQAIPLQPRRAVPRQPSAVCFASAAGTMTMQDLYVGDGLRGVAPGAVKSLRVVALRYRAAAVGFNRNGTHAMTPVSVGFGSWDVKDVLGEVPVASDGSACFEVPARTPVYLQAVDHDGQVLQTMRSWVTLQPGESVSCIGCHEDKAMAPPAGRKPPMAARQSPAALVPLAGLSGGFSFPKSVQPILDRHCVRCHRNARIPPPGGFPRSAIAWEKARVVSPRLARWRFTTSPPDAGWEHPGFVDAGWREAQGGFGREGTPGGKILSPWHSRDIWLRRSVAIADDPRALAWAIEICHDEDVEVFLNGERAASGTGYITAYRVMPVSSRAAAALQRGHNTIAVHCRQTTGGQYIDVALLAAEMPQPDTPGDATGTAFSLRGDHVEIGTGRRRWSDAYLALTGARYDNEDFQGHPSDLVNWISAKSPPPMLPPYSAGSATSRLPRLLQEGHHGVHLDPAELAILRCWIDLLVPYCGDYREASAWSPAEDALYRRREQQRQAHEDEEKAVLSRLAAAADRAAGQPH